MQKLDLLFVILDKLILIFDDLLVVIDGLTELISSAVAFFLNLINLVLFLDNLLLKSFDPLFTEFFTDLLELLLNVYQFFVQSIIDFAVALPFKRELLNVALLSLNPF